MSRSNIKLGLPGVLALTLASVGMGWGISSLADEHYHDAAVDLLDHGRRLTVRDVEVYLDTYRSTTSVDEVRVSFRVDGRDVTTELIAGQEPVDDGDLPDGWQRPFDGSFYAPPLEIVVAPDDVEFAMAAHDVELYRTSTVARNLAVSGGLIAGAAALLLAKFLWGRTSRADPAGATGTDRQGRTAPVTGP
jgi:hypothetical protein